MMDDRAQFSPFLPRGWLTVLILLLALSFLSAWILSL